MLSHSSNNDNEAVISEAEYSNLLQPLQVRLSRVEAETHLRKTIDKVGSEDVVPHPFQTPTKNLTPLPTSEQGEWYSKI